MKQDALKYSRGWAKIDIDALHHNLEEISRCSGDVPVLAVIKADGYGHGAVMLAREMERLPGISGYAVATEEEAVSLADAGIKKPIMVLGYTFPENYEEMARRSIRATAFTEEMLHDMGRAALSCGSVMKVHIAVDTGMSRIGIRPDDSGLDFVKKASETDGIEIEGLFTHFATADEADKTRTNAQFQAFYTFAERIRTELGISIPLRHCANSAGILELPDTRMDMVRAGIILYGLWPSEEVSRASADLLPVLSLYSRVAFVKDLEAGREVSYGGTFTAAGPMRVATIPVGYADGYPRGLSNKGSVLIRGKRAPILGRVCMDQFMVDVTHIPETACGDIVTLIGTDGAEHISMEELGELSGRFNYEIACCLSKRIPRVYEKCGERVGQRDYFHDESLFRN